MWRMAQFSLLFAIFSLSTAVPVPQSCPKACLDYIAEFCAFDDKRDTCAECISVNVFWKQPCPNTSEHQETCIAEFCSKEEDDAKNTLSPQLWNQTRNAAAELDWRDTGCVSPVLTEGQNTSKAFAVDILFEQLRCVIANRGQILPPLSLQQMVDCAGADEPSGYLFGWAMKYAVSKGVEMETSYPAVAHPSSCHYQKKYVAVTIESVGQPTNQGDEAALATALENAPINAVLQIGEEFMTYNHGVLKSCGENTVGAQTVEIVAHGVDAKEGAYWTVKLPWGTSFGENGYVRIAKGQGNVCGIADTWNYPVGVKYI